MLLTLILLSGYSLSNFRKEVFIAFFVRLDIAVLLFSEPVFEMSICKYTMKQTLLQVQKKELRGNRPPQPCFDLLGYLISSRLVLGIISSFFGKVSFRIPSLYSAVISSVFTPVISKLLEKLP